MTTTTTENTRRLPTTLQLLQAEWLPKQPETTVSKAKAAIAHIDATTATVRAELDEAEQRERNTTASLSQPPPKATTWHRSSPPGDPAEPTPSNALPCSPEPAASPPTNTPRPNATTPPTCNGNPSVGASNRTGRSPCPATPTTASISSLSSLQHTRTGRCHDPPATRLAPLAPGANADDDGSELRSRCGARLPPMWRTHHGPDVVGLGSSRRRRHRRAHRARSSEVQPCQWRRHRRTPTSSQPPSATTV